MPRVGLKGHVYCKVGNAFVAMKIARDVTIPVSKNEIPLKNKGSELIRYLSGLIDVPIDLEADWEPGDPVFDALHDCFWNGGSLEFKFLDQPEGTGAKGLQGEFIVTKFERSEPLEDVMSVSIALRLAADSTLTRVGSAT